MENKLNNPYISNSALAVATLLCSLENIQNTSAMDCIRCNTEDNSNSSEISQSSEEFVNLPIAEYRGANNVSNTQQKPTPSTEEFIPLPIADIKKPSIYDIKENPKYNKDIKSDTNTQQQTVSLHTSQILETKKSPLKEKEELSTKPPLNFNSIYETPVQSKNRKPSVQLLANDPYKKYSLEKLIKLGDKGDEKAQKIHLDNLMRETQREVKKNSGKGKTKNSNNENDHGNILDNIRNEFLKKIVKLCDDKQWALALQMRKELMDEKNQHNGPLLKQQIILNNSHSRRLSESTFSESTLSDSRDFQSTISSSSTTSSTSSEGESYKNLSKDKLIQSGNDGDRKAQRRYLKVLKEEAKEKAEEIYLQNFKEKKSDREINFNKLYLEKLSPYCNKDWKEAKKEEKKIKGKTSPSKKKKRDSISLSKGL